jgi:Lrp/AsnC family transcriptional regulator, leucine-responsive regulatory protein
MADRLQALHKRLLQVLQENAKSTYQQLAIEAQTSEATAARQVRELENSGVIRGYHAHVDPAHIGLMHAVFVLVQVKNHDTVTLNRFLQMVREDDRITECHLLKGDYDYILRIYVRDDEEYVQFMDALIETSLVSHYTTCQTMRVEKQTHRLPLEHIGIA